MPRARRPVHPLHSATGRWPERQPVRISGARTMRRFCKDLECGTGVDLDR